MEKSARSPGIEDLKFAGECGGFRQDRRQGRERSHPC